MKELLNKLLVWLHIRKVPLMEFTPQMTADMQAYEANLKHWPEIPANYNRGDTVWFIGKGKLPCKGFIDKIKMKHGRMKLFICYDEDPDKGLALKFGEPLFRTKRDLLMYQIGNDWKEVARLLKGLAKVPAKETNIRDYVLRRVNDYKGHIETLERLLEKDERRP